MGIPLPAGSPMLTFAGEPETTDQTLYEVNFNGVQPGVKSVIVIRRNLILA